MAKKELTSILLNRGSGRLANSCAVDVAQIGCTSTNLGSLIDELAGLINSGSGGGFSSSPSRQCKQAKDCARAINTGSGLESSELMTPMVAPDDLPPSNDGLPPISGGLAWSGSAVGETPVVEPTTDVAPDTSMVAVVPVAGDSDGETREVEELESTIAEDRYIDELLTDLGGGYEPDARLEMVLQLIERVDESLHSLLIAHLFDIADEARAFGEEDLAERAEQLVERLEPPLEE
jgi:hypothetical protein